MLHQPGNRTGSVPWQGTILPLDHWYDVFDFFFFFLWEYISLYNGTLDKVMNIYILYNDTLFLNKIYIYIYIYIMIH